MLTPTGYWIAFVLLAVLCATVALVASRHATVRRFLTAWVMTAVLLAVVGYLDWAAQPQRETSLTTYVLIALLTPLGALAVAWRSRGSSAPMLRWLTAAVVTFVINVGVIMAAYVTGF